VLFFPRELKHPRAGPNGNQQRIETDHTDRTDRSDRGSSSSLWSEKAYSFCSARRTIRSDPFNPFDPFSAVALLHASSFPSCSSCSLLQGNLPFIGIVLSANSAYGFGDLCAQGQSVLIPFHPPDRL
jgi:hypothetical protein